jgi:hypothetical protein
VDYTGESSGRLAISPPYCQCAQLPHPVGWLQFPTARDMDSFDKRAWHFFHVFSLNCGIRLLLERESWQRSKSLSEG